MRLFYAPEFALNISTLTSITFSLIRRVYILIKNFAAIRWRYKFVMYKMIKNII